MQAIVGLILGVILGVITALVTLAVTGSGGTAATFGIIVFLAVGVGFIVFTSDSNWFD